MWLGTALLAPLCGPLLVVALGRRPTVRAAFDAFLIVAMGGLLLLHVLPEGLHALGWPGIPALLLGLMLPKLLHGADHDHGPPPAAPEQAPALPFQRGHHHSSPQSLMRALGALALILHAGVDGVALAPHEGVPIESLAVAVGLHRLIEGAGIWWLLRARLGRVLALSALWGLVCVTGVGFFGGHWAQSHGFVAGASFVQMMVAGSLVHLLVWHPPQDEAACSMPATAPPERWQRFASAVGALVAAAALLSMEHQHGHSHGHAHGHVHAHNAPVALMLPASMPIDMLVPLGQAMLLSLVLAALAHSLGSWPRRKRTRVTGPWRGAVSGLFVPACSCGVVALAERRRDVGTTAHGDISFLLAAPAMGWVGFVASMLLLGPVMTVLRALCVVVLSYAVARFTCALSADVAATSSHASSAMTANHGVHCAHGDAHLRPTTFRKRVGLRVRDGLHFAFGEMLDFTAPWLSFAVMLAIVMAANVPAIWVQRPTLLGIDVWLFSVFAAPVYVCAAASTVVATCLWQAGASPGSVLSLLLITSSISVASVHALWRWHTRATAICTILLYITGAMACGYGVNAMANVSPLFSMALWPPVLQHDMSSNVTVIMAALLVLLSLMRQGLRGFVGQLLWANGPQAASEHHP